MRKQVVFCVLLIALASAQRPTKPKITVEQPNPPPKSTFVPASTQVPSQRQPDPPPEPPSVPAFTQAPSQRQPDPLPEPPSIPASTQQKMKLAVLEPEGKGLSNDELWMLSLAQGTIMANFNKYSAVTIIDRQNLEAIIAEQKRSLSAMTSDEDAIQIGNLANANHILTGKLTKTPNAFMLELAITDAETGVRKASLLPKTVSPKEFENLSALKEASADLLKQLGVSLTDEQLAELRGPVAETQVQAQTALAHGVVAQRQGTSVAALSYFYQAAAFDPSLAEAVKRSSIMSANISGINLGENIRNDIVWRKNWVEQLKETEETFWKIISSAAPPYTLYYSTVIETKNINYQKETADLNISINLLANAEWFAAFQRSLRAAMAVQRGLDATGRKKDWGMNEWPYKGVSDTNPFRAGWYSDKSKEYDIPVEFELVNQQGKLIGKQVAWLRPSISINNKFIVIFETNKFSTLTFYEVNANDISDNLTIRLASVNGEPPETARFPITVVKTKEFPEYKVQTRKTTFTDSRDGRKYGAVEIGGITWMSENLNFNASDSKCYSVGYNKKTRNHDIKLSNIEIQVNCNKYGRLYNWETAMKACPIGWHLPSGKYGEWDALITVVGGEKTAGKYLKAKSGWNQNGNGTDIYGFAALPGSYSFPNNISFHNVGDEGFWWEATLDAYIDYQTDKRSSYYRRMSYHNDGVNRDHSGKFTLYSVRCVED